ncbi:MAG: hypothetical protein QM770_15520 [Tepidisphaeraceae bacterium]
MRTTRSLLALQGCFLLSTLGCHHDDGAIKPMPADAAYRSPLASDPTRAGDFRKDGLLQQRVTPTAPTTSAATKPTVTPPPGAPQYVQVGALIAEVNGKPIYAHKVIKLVAASLKPAALQIDNPRQFRARARDEIKRQRDELINDEIVYAAAERETTPDEKNLAKMLTGQFYENLKSKAGGSLAVARQQADNDDDGRTFDELLEYESRRNLVRIYYQRRLRPRAAASVDEMRSFYIRHKEDMFSTSASAKFKLIRIDIPTIGSDEAAKAKAEEIRARAEGRGLRHARRRLQL